MPMRTAGLALSSQHMGPSISRAKEGQGEEGRESLTWERESTRGRGLPVLVTWARRRPTSTFMGVVLGQKWFSGP